MEQPDRSAVLYAVAYAPGVGLRLTISYLRMKRAARRAERRFYHELVRSGLPATEARSLAVEYGAAISIKSMVNGLGNGFPFQERR